MGGTSLRILVPARLALVGALVLGMTLAGCGSSSKSASSNVISSGQVDIQLPDGWKVTKSGAVRPAVAAESPSGASGASGVSGASGASGGSGASAVPLAKENPITTFFGALGIFQKCLKGLNVKFIGVPDGKDPKNPVNDPTYIKNLSTCAAKSNIVQALTDVQKAQDSMTPKQIETQNKGYLKWRTCMIGRGWGIPKPKPDAKGRLFSFGAGGGSSVPQFTPPPGQDIVTSSDTQECAAEAVKSLPNSNLGG